ncbi:MAG: sensor histidine kinase [Lachnospiraceae bacterium]|nr:sensor histidine kinase [Lachnospiraceae bacterium]
MELLEELSICCQKKERIDNEEQDNICYCKDIVVDSVIYNKVRTCRESGIQTKISMEDFDKGNISDLEILGLLYNLFDNAIEACQRVKEGERFIEISAVKVAGRLMLTIRNSMREVEVRNGRLVTSKKNKDFHGVGLGIIEDFVKKHRGVMKIKAKDGVFEVDIGVEIW